MLKHVRGFLMGVEMNWGFWVGLGLKPIPSPRVIAHFRGLSSSLTVGRHDETCWICPVKVFYIYVNRNGLV